MEVLMGVRAVVTQGPMCIPGLRKAYSVRVFSSHENVALSEALGPRSSAVTPLIKPPDLWRNRRDSREKLRISYYPP